MAQASDAERMAEAERLLGAGREAEALSAYRALAEAGSSDAAVWFNLGWLARRAGEAPLAADAYRKALSLGIERPEDVHLNLASLYSGELRDLSRARAALDDALRIAPDFVPALINLGNLHEDEGDRAAAAAAYQRALEAEPANRLALARLGGVHRTTSPEDPLVARIGEALHAPGLSPIDRADLGFALGRMLDEAGSFEGAFTAYRDANRASAEVNARAGRSYDRARTEEAMAALPRQFEQPRQGPSHPPMIFICGMYRSGSTLLEQVLSGHPRVTAGGELNFLPRIMKRSGARGFGDLARQPDSAIAAQRDLYLRWARRLHPDADILTDKRPDNILRIGYIKTLFPEAKVVVTERQALDNVLSVWFTQLGPAFPYATSLRDTAHQLRMQRALARAWRGLYGDDVVTFDYDAFVARPEEEARRILAALGLSYEPACLDFQKRDHPVQTASVWQVRQPLHTRSSGRWQHYARHLGEAREELGLQPPDGSAS